MRDVHLALGLSVGIGIGVSILIRWRRSAKRLQHLRNMVRTYFTNSQAGVERMPIDKVLWIIDRRCELEVELTEARQLLTKYQNTALWDDILAWNFAKLQAHLQHDEVRPMDVLCAYLSAALKAHKATNCLVAILFDVEKRARELEMRFKDKKPPLYGIPISLKENIAVSGLTMTGGYAQFLSSEATANAPIVNILLELGAIPFVRTNVPQNLFCFLASNPIYGATTHPQDANRSSGGSSGGEGALIGFGGSILGIGSDIAGSVRLPAHWNGIVALKPTMARWSLSESRGVAPGIEGIGKSQGPMARDTTALVALLRALYAEDSPMMRETYAAPLPFREEMYQSTGKLRIGYFEDDGWFPSTPACRRAVQEAVAKLRSIGHEVVAWSPPDVGEIFRLLWPLCHPDGGAYLVGRVDSDIVEPLNEWLVSLYRVPGWRKRLTATWARLQGDWRRALILDALPTNTTQLREAFAATSAYRKRFSDLFVAAELDAVVCPPGATPALPNESVMPLLPIFSYTALFNVIDYPAGVVPFTKVSAVDEAGMSTYPSGDPQLAEVRRVCSSGTVGLPVGVQIAALPYHEETVLRLMTLLEK